MTETSPAPETPQASTPKQRPRWRRWLRRGLLFLFVGVPMLLGLALLILQTDAAKRALRDTAIDAIVKKVPGLKVERIDGSLISTIELHNISLADRFGQPVLHINLVRLSYQPGALLRKHVVVEKLEVLGLTLNIGPSQDGKLNLTNLVLPDNTPAPSDAPEQPMDWAIDLKRLEVQGKRISVTAEAGEPIELRDIALGLAASYTGQHASASLEQLSMRVKLPKRPAFALNLSGNGGLAESNLKGKLKAVSKGLLPGHTSKIDIDVKGALKQGPFNFAIKIKPTPDGAVTVSGNVALNDGGLGAYQAQVDIERLATQPILASLTDTVLNASLEATGRGLPLSPDSTLSTTLKVRPSRVYGRQLTKLALAADLAGRTWKLAKLDLRTPAVTLTGDGNGDFKHGKGKLKLAVHDASRLPLPANVPRLAGSITLDLNGEADLAGKISGKLGLTTQNLVVDQFAVRSLSAGTDLSGTVADPKATNVSLSATHVTHADRIVLDTLVASGSGSQTAVDLVAAGRGNGTAAEISLEANRKKKQELAGRLRQLKVTHHNLAFKLLKSADWRVNIARGSANWRGLSARLLSGSLRSEGTLSWKRRTAKANLELVNIDLAALKKHIKSPVTQGRLKLSLDVKGPLRAPLGTVDVSLRGGRVADTPLALKLTGRFNKKASRVDLTARSGSAANIALTAEARSRLDALIDPKRRAVTPLSLDLRLPQHAIARLRRLVPQIPEDLAGTVAATVNLAGTAQRLKGDVRLSSGKLAYGSHRLDKLRLNLRIDTAAAASKVAARVHVFGIAKPTVVANLTIKRPLLRLISRPQLAAISGRASLRIPRLSPFRPIAAELEKARGTLNGEVTVDGTLGRPKGVVSLLGRGMAFGQYPLGDLNAQIKARPEHIVAKIALRERQARVEGQASLRLPSKQLAGRFTAHGFKLAAIAPLLAGTPVRELAGNLESQIQLAGRANQPKLTGRLTLSKGTLRIARLPSNRDISLKLRFSENAIHVGRLFARAKDGKIEGRATVKLKSFRPQSAVASLALTRYPLGFDPGHKATLRGKLDVKAKLGDAGNTIDVRLVDGLVRVPELAVARSLEATKLPSDIVFVTSTAPTGDTPAKPKPRAAKPTPLRLTVKADPLWARGKQLDLELYADIVVAPTKDGQLAPKGRAGIRRGWVEVLDKRYRVAQATVYFDGTAPPDPQLNVVLTRRFPEALVYIELRGPSSNPKLRLRSEPAIYTRDQLLSLLLTGRLDVGRDGGETNAAGMVSAALSQALLGAVLGSVAKKVGIDVAKVQVDSEGDQVKARTELGSYLTDRLYIGYRGVFGASENENANEGLLEYRISQRWLLHGYYGDAGNGGLDLFWTYVY